MHDPFDKMLFQEPEAMKPKRQSRKSKEPKERRILLETGDPPAPPENPPPPQYSITVTEAMALVRRLEGGADSARIETWSHWPTDIPQAAMLIRALLEGYNPQDYVVVDPAKVGK